MRTGLSGAHPIDDRRANAAPASSNEAVEFGIVALDACPFVTGQPQRIGALDAALEYICSHAGVWRATGWEIVQDFLAQLPGEAH